MSPTHEQRMNYVHSRLKECGITRVKQAQRVGAEGKPDHVSGALLLAIGLRESGLRNVLGDHGHARGSHQIHDAFHAHWLRSVPGCKASPTIAGHTDACWDVIPGKTAMDAGYCPRFIDSCRFTADTLNEFVAQAARSKVKDSDRIRVAVAAFNAGMGNALKGYRAGDPDRFTTLHDYSADVLLRRSEVSEWLRLHPNWSV